MRGEPEKRVKARKGLSLSSHVHGLIDQTRSLHVAVSDTGQRELYCVVSILLFQSRITKPPLLTPIAKVSRGNLLHVVILSVATSK